MEDNWEKYIMKEKAKKVLICGAIAILTAIFAVSVYVAVKIMIGG